MIKHFEERLFELQQRYEALINRPNSRQEPGFGIFDRYTNPVLTAMHIPLRWRYDLNRTSNPRLLERLGFNSVFNAGAIKWGDRYLLCARIEGADGNSFFALAESPNGIDRFRFWERPVTMPGIGGQETNLYDMRLTRHEDGWVYGTFCTEAKDPAASDQHASITQCGIVRTRDLHSWERLANIKTPLPQQRNVVLHSEFVADSYAFYTRPQDRFTDAGCGNGLAFGLSTSITEAVIKKEVFIDRRTYHTVAELKNGLGPAPLKTDLGWLHLQHGTRHTDAGLRQMCYLFLTDLAEPTKISYKPGGYFIAQGNTESRDGAADMLLCNGWIADEDGRVFVYYSGSDARMHVATTTIGRLLDFVLNSPPDVEPLNENKTVN